MLEVTRNSCANVALRKESVDRNVFSNDGTGEFWKSLSARRAWIEIQVEHQWADHSDCRSPQGERG